MPVAALSPTTLRLPSRHGNVRTPSQAPLPFAPCLLRVAHPPAYRYYVFVCATACSGISRGQGLGGEGEGAYCTPHELIGTAPLLLHYAQRERTLDTLHKAHTITESNDLVGNTLSSILFALPPAKPPLFHFVLLSGARWWDTFRNRRQWWCTTIKCSVPLLAKQLAARWRTASPSPPIALRVDRWRGGRERRSRMHCCW